MYMKFKDVYSPRNDRGDNGWWSGLDHGGYPFPTGDTFDFAGLLNAGVQTGAATFADDGTEHDAMAEYLLANHAMPETAFDEADTGRDLDGRIVNLAYRDGAELDAAVDNFAFVQAARPANRTRRAPVAAGLSHAPLDARWRCGSGVTVACTNANLSQEGQRFQSARGTCPVLAVFHR